MGKIRLGIIAPADIAKRRFIPALLSCENFELAGIAARKGSEQKRSPDRAGICRNTVVIGKAGREDDQSRHQRHKGIE